MEQINYYELLKELVKFDVGLYKGYSSNYVYNTPNKVHEYLACGLGALTSNRLTSTIELNHEKITAVAFKNINHELLINF